jgi:hypothetical protein
VQLTRGSESNRAERVKLRAAQTIRPFKIKTPPARVCWLPLVVTEGSDNSARHMWGAPAEPANCHTLEKLTSTSLDRLLVTTRGNGTV